MRFTSFAVLLAFVLLIPAGAVPASAQSAIERSFVPKARLDDPFWTQHDETSQVAVDHGAWDDFLAKYVNPDKNGVNRVAYGRVNTADKKALSDYLKSLESVNVAKLNRNEQFAYWVNFYNASTVSIALAHYPIESIRDVKKNALDFLGPFNDEIAKVNGRTLTLNTIESGIVRPIWKDPRLHYAFNCAAITCPNLAEKAYRGATLDADLDNAARAYVNDPRGIAIKDGKATASKIFFWYEDDFGGSEAAILDHMKRYAGPELKAQLSSLKTIDAYVYDWTLNDAR